MSRAFVRNDAEDDDVVVPQRAPLPPGAVNYVTARGLALLRSELAGLEAERSRLQAGSGDDGERKRALALLAGRLRALAGRIAEAQLVAVPGRPWDKVRFGAIVTVRPAAGVERCYAIVGVDEADAGAGRLAYTAPLARAILGLRVGETAELATPQGSELLEVVAITYEDAAHSAS